VIEVQDSEGDLFDEPTSREGLIETPAFQELRELVSSVLITGAQMIAEQRDRPVSGEIMFQPALAGRPPSQSFLAPTAISC
jgi:hypothetical protein